MRHRALINSGDFKRRLPTGSSKFNFYADFTSTTQFSAGTLLNQTSQSGHKFDTADGSVYIGMEGSPQRLSLIGGYTTRTHSSPYFVPNDLYDKGVDITITGNFFGFNASYPLERCAFYNPCGFYGYFSGQFNGTSGNNLYITNGLTTYIYDLPDGSFFSKLS